LKLRAEPYTIELRQDEKKSEHDLRRKINIELCNGIFFNASIVENKTLVEYDSIILYEKDNAMLFIEYKDSVSSYKNLKAHDTQRKKDLARNIARAFGYKNYDFVLVVKGLEIKEEKIKGKTTVISLDELDNYMLKLDSFESALEELDYVKWLLSKYDREENQVEYDKKLAIEELKILRDKIEQVNKK